MRSRRAGALVAAGALLASGCLAGGREPSSDQISVAVRRPSSLDPVKLRDSSGILIARQLLGPLAGFDPGSSQLRPGAARWETHDAGARYVFHLSPQSRFHNGRKVGAEDARFALNRLARKETGSEAAFLLESVAGFDRVNITGEIAELEGIHTIDEDSFEIRLDAPWVDFPYVLTHPSTAPIPRAEYETDPAGFEKRPAGSGPYRLIEPLAEGRDVVVRAAAAARRGVKIGTVRFVLYDRAEDAWRDFEKGRVDIAEAPPGKVEFASAKYAKDGLLPVAAGIYLGFNLRNPKLSDLRLRQAISLAIDREAIAHSVYGDALVAAPGIIPPGIPGRSETACGRNCERNLRRAKALVAEVFPGGGAPSIAYDYPSGGADEAAAEALKANLSEIGITLELRPREAELAAFFDLISTGGHEVFRLAWPAEYPLADWFLYPLFSSGSPDNHTGYAVPEVDELLNRARSTLDRSSRLALYRQVERRVLADMAVVPLGFFRSRFVAGERIRGFYTDRLGGFEVARFDP